MKRKHLSALAVAIALFLAAPSAKAALISGSFSGIINQTPTYNYFDYENAFGLGANANLAGLAISGAFSYNAAGIGPVCGPDGSATECNYLGVSDRFAVTILGHTLTILGNYVTELVLVSDHGLRNDFALGAVNTGFVDIGILVRSFSGQFPIDETDPDSPDFAVDNPDQYIGQLFLTGISGFNFSIQHLEVGPEAVPEPPSLLLLASLGLLGLAMRRATRRR